MPTTTRAPTSTGKNKKTGCWISGETTIRSAVAHAGGWRQRAACITSSASAIATIAATSRYPPISTTTPSATAAERNCPATTFQVREAVILASTKIIAIDAANGATNNGSPNAATESLLRKSKMPIAKALPRISIGEILRRRCGSRRSTNVRTEDVLTSQAYRPGFRRIEPRSRLPCPTGG